MVIKADKDIFEVLIKDKQLVEGMRLEKLQNNSYKVFQDGFYAGKLDQKLAQDLTLRPVTIDSKDV